MSEEIWRKQFGQTPALGYCLRTTYPERWIRFHDLPESKRYANDQAERNIILQRANALGDELFGEHGDLLILYSRPSDISNDIAYDPKRLFDEGWKAEGQFSFVDQFFDDVDDQIVWLAFYKKALWRRGAFDETFLKIADDELSHFLFISLETHEVLAPFEGGFDLILQSDARVQLLKRTWPDWLSARKDML